jgi:hypothetical protein
MGSGVEGGQTTRLLLVSLCASLVKHRYNCAVPFDVATPESSPVGCAVPFGVATPESSPVGCAVPFGVATPESSPVGCAELRIVAGFPQRGTGFELSSRQVGFVVDKVAQGQVFSQYFGFPCHQFHRLLHTHHHPPSGAGTVAQTVVCVPSAPSLTPTTKTLPNSESAESVGHTPQCAVYGARRDSLPPHMRT